MAQIKGATIISRLDYISKTYGEEARAQAMAGLQKDFGAEVGLFLPISLYPLRMDDSLCRFIQKRAGLAGEEAFQQLGRHSAHEHRKFFGALLEGRKDVHDLLARVPRLSASYGKDVGTMTYERTGERSASLFTEGASESFRSMCASNVAYIVEAADNLMGAKLRAEEPACVCWGHPRCEYRFSW